MKKPYYITTAIAYSSGIPHIGNVYEIILADAIARFKRLEGYDVFFQTGTDEHGQKIEKQAKLNNQDPQDYVDHISTEIKRIFDLVDISYDNFVRTTNQKHVLAVQDMFKKLLENGDIYLGKYEGWYSISEESFIFEKDIVDGKGPRGDELIWTEEEVYFLKMSKYQERLVNKINNDELLIIPSSRKNEMVNNFLKEPLPDLSVSRTSFKWGVPVSFNKDHVIYVWMDALSNYITSLGYNPYLDESEMMKKLWPADLQIIGKDILRFHTIYWPIILMALELELPKVIFGHPWILFDKQKMSKSKGNILYTDDLVKHFGVDRIRYYVLHEIPYQQDGNMTYELVIERSNSDLTNTIGNLVNRTIGMVNKYNNGVVKKVLLDEPFELDLKDIALNTLPKMKEHMKDYHVSQALEEVMVLARAANKYIDVSMPWVLFKDDSKTDELNHVLYTLLEAIRYISVLLQPFIPNTSNKIFKMLGIKDKSFESLSTFGLFKEQTLNKAEVLFERYDETKKIEEILKENEKNKR